MSGIKLVIPGRLNNPSLPILYEEPRLTTGSLLLVDPAHPFATWPAEAFGVSAAVPNLAWRQAAAVLGGGDATSLASGVQFTGDIQNSNGHVEKTARGGLHVIRRQGGGVPPAAGAIVQFPAAVITHLFNHRDDHKFYFSLWSAITRTAASTRALFGGITHIDANYLYMFSPDGDQPTGPTRLGGRTVNAAGLGNSFRSIGVNGSVNGYGEATFYNEGAAWRSGGNLNWTAGGTGSKQSQIFYCAYAEDLTVSGRTYEQVDAIDHALYVKDVLTPGGRYYQDSYTDPTTYP